MSFASVSKSSSQPGYGGSIVHVDLTSGIVTDEPLPQSLVMQYVGGRGFCARMLFDEVPVGSDPLGPDNRVVVASGPLASAYMPAGAKVEFAAKSPATGGYGDSNMGGHLAAEMKYAGVDVIVVKGTSPRPVYLLIDDERRELRDASHLWGLGSGAAEKALKEELGHDFQIATIGPAGENAVAFACVCHDFGRQAGRTGIGAVLGAKRLKAIAVRGTRGVEVYDLPEVRRLGEEMFRFCQEAPALKEWQDYGTATVTTWVNKIGCFPTKNFWTSYFDKYQELSAERMRERIVVADKACFACPMCCGKYSHVKLRAGNQEVEAYVEGPEYETTALVGGNCLLGSIEEIAYANHVLDELGLDTISAGSVIAWTLECLERGILTAKDVGREGLRFGDLESVLWLADRIARREGIGDLLARGVRAAAEALGHGSDQFAIHVKGLEMSGYECRNAPAMLLSYMTADIGAAHNRSWAVTHDLAVGRDVLAGKAAKVIELQHIRPLFDTLGVCRLQWIELSMPVEKYAEMFRAVTGIPYSWDDLMLVSERVFNLTRCFNAREIPGFGRSYDQPPARFLMEPTPTGPSAGTMVTQAQVDYLLNDYYRLRGWAEDGLPTADKLKELGLEDCVAVVAKARSER